MFEPECTTNPLDEVNELYKCARRIKSLDPSLARVINEHKDLFLDVFARQISLIKTRSQDLQDAHVTVYDKVLLALTEQGDHLENPAAITWYCAEYFGFNPDVEADHNERAIQQSLAFPVALARRPKHPDVSSPIVESYDSRLVTPAPTSPVTKGHATWTVKDDANWQRFRDIYESAVKDFNQVVDERSTRTHEAARWLRDTAENGIHFLQRFSDPDSAQHNVADLKETYTMAQRVVEDLTGGKKRKFDHQDENKPKLKNDNPDRGPSQVREDAHKARSKSSTRELFPEKHPRKSRAHIHPQAQTHSYRRSRAYHYPAAVERSDEPYGYGNSRMVDSYVPVRENSDRNRYSRRY